MAYTAQQLGSEPDRAELDQRSAPTVIEFGTGWCGYCQAAQPLIAAAFEDYPDVEHIKIEDGKGRRLGRSFRVKLWPTLIFWRDGREVDRLVRPGSSPQITQNLARIHSNGGTETAAPEP